MTVLVKQLISGVSIQPPPRWTPRSLMVMFMPHLFRKMRHFQEATGPSTEKVPVDADVQQHFSKSKTKKMKQAVYQMFGIVTSKPRWVPREAAWSIATGEWVSEASLRLEYIFPLSLGPTIAREVSPSISWRGGDNGMMVPHTVGQEFNDWSLVIVPDKSWRQERKPFSYVFQVLEMDKKSLLSPIYPYGTLEVRDLHGARLNFRPRGAARLNPHSCYFHSCCAMWKSTFLEDPSRTPEQFWERFQTRMSDLWGTRKDREGILLIFKPPELVNKAEEAAEALTGLMDGIAVDSEPEADHSEGRAETGGSSRLSMVRQSFHGHTNHWPANKM